MCLRNVGIDLEVHLALQLRRPTSTTILMHGTKFLESLLYENKIPYYVMGLNDSYCRKQAKKHEKKALYIFF
jgi:hypothetical protein